MRMTPLFPLACEASARLPPPPTPLPSLFLFSLAKRRGLAPTPQLTSFEAGNPLLLPSPLPGEGGGGGSGEESHPEAASRDPSPPRAGLGPTPQPSLFGGGTCLSPRELATAHFASSWWKPEIGFPRRWQSGAPSFGGPGILPLNLLYKAGVCGDLCAFWFPSECGGTSRKREGRNGGDVRKNLCRAAPLWLWF